jgi:hypothetical protein
VAAKWIDALGRSDAVFYFFDARLIAVRPLDRKPFFLKQAFVIGHKFRHP